jgi:hypothetical protein
MTHFNRGVEVLPLGGVPAKAGIKPGHDTLFSTGALGPPLERGMTQLFSLLFA